MISGNHTTFVVFGGSGQLTKTRLIPSLFRLFVANRLPQYFSVVGVSRTNFTDEEYRAYLFESLNDNSTESIDFDQWNEFANHVWYQPLDVGKKEDFENLKTVLEQIEQRPCNRLYYLSTLPNLQMPIITSLGEFGFHISDDGWRRLAIEKPFGFDYQTSHEINVVISKFFKEDQVFRVDHYLGKETSQNILHFRFANVIFEALWNRKYIDNIQITVAENQDVSPHGEYYDIVGVLRDIFQNRLLQFLALLTMEPPNFTYPEQVRDERSKLLHAVLPARDSDVVLGQYEGYRSNSGVSPNSLTPTFAVMKLGISNWRWDGVPIYIRSGKALSEKRSEIVIEFQSPPLNLFELPPSTVRPNYISMCISPDEGIHLGFVAKRPDVYNEASEVDLEFHYRDIVKDAILPDAYEQVLMDILDGDTTFFIRNDEVELSWNIIESIIRNIENTLPLYLYQPGSEGPSEAASFIEKDGRIWLANCVH
ncbi:MAG: glucose-6-phosphate dehydrogenase [Anaerolineae bacterium]|nr:glucose-6-phosphate dehydrogenase [Anaerolineae bacterium]NUQ03909.1 glucose-6-phosphate dehydrogenase [Anaerolineae bacterium]